MVIVGMSVVATVIVLQFHHHSLNNGHMPRWVSSNTEGNISLILKLQEINSSRSQIMSTKRAGQTKKLLVLYVGMLHYFSKAACVNNSYFLQTALE